MSEIEYEHEWDVVAVNDGRKDYYFRLSQLIPDLNVVQSKKMEQDVDDRQVIALGPRTDTIDVHHFMERAHELHLTIELT